MIGIELGELYDPTKLYYFPDRWAWVPILQNMLNAFKFVGLTITYIRAYVTKWDQKNTITDKHRLGYIISLKLQGEN